MIKLRDVKCPNCGADIQVNDKLENTICQYCGSQVLIEEAIEKYQVELSGKVEVEGIKGRTTQIRQAKKHFAIQEYDKAKEILLEIISEDEFDVEAYAELVKIDIEKIKQSNFNEKASRLTERNNWYILDEMFNYYERIKKIDEEGIGGKELKDYLEDIKHYEELSKQVETDEKELKEYIDRLNIYWEKIKTMKYENYTYWLDNIVKEYFDISGIVAQYSQSNDMRYSDWYDMIKFDNISRDGILNVLYRNRTRVYSTSDTQLYPAKHRTYASVEEVKSNLEKILANTEQYISKNKVPKKPAERKIYQCSVCGYKGEYWHEGTNLYKPLLIALCIIFWPAAIFYGISTGTKIIRTCPNCKKQREY